MVLGEGAGMLVLEARERALARGAEILAEITGYGTSADAQDMVAPSEDGAALAMSRASPMPAPRPARSTISVPTAPARSPTTRWRRVR